MNITFLNKTSRDTIGERLFFFLKPTKAYQIHEITSPRNTYIYQIIFRIMIIIWFICIFTSTFLIFTLNYDCHIEEVKDSSGAIPEGTYDINNKTITITAPIKQKNIKVTYETMPQLLFETETGALIAAKFNDFEISDTRIQDFEVDQLNTLASELFVSIGYELTGLNPLVGLSWIDDETSVVKSNDVCTYDGSEYTTTVLTDYTTYSTGMFIQYNTIQYSLIHNISYHTTIEPSSKEMTRCTLTIHCNYQYTSKYIMNITLGIANEFNHFKYIFTSYNDICNSFLFFHPDVIEDDLLDLWAMEASIDHQQCRSFLDRFLDWLLIIEVIHLIIIGVLTYVFEKIK